MRKVFVSAFFLLLFLSVAPSVSAKEIFVDNKISGNCNGNYSIGSRNCSGSDGDAYKSPGDGVNNMVSGDTLSIRGGEYTVTQMSLNFSGSQTVIQGYLDENPTLYKPEIRRGIFAVGSNSNNLEIRNMTLKSRFYEVVNGWEQYSGNVWRHERPYHDEPTELRFNLEWSTNSGHPVSSLTEVNSTKEWVWQDGYIYVYSEGNPDNVYTNPGINIIDDYDAVGISGKGGAEATVTNVYFSDFAHGGIKGSTKWHVKNSYFDNIGTDSNDHHIYFGAQFDAGNESIIENNYFGATKGYGAHMYTNPSHYIIRNNIFDCKNTGEGAIVLAGNNISVYNNTIYNCPRGVFFFRSGSQNNIVKNNLFYNNTYNIELDHGEQIPNNNVVSYNYFDDSACRNCNNFTSSGGANLTGMIDSTNIINSSNPFVVTNPSNWADFRLKSGAAVIDAGIDLGASNANALSPSDTSWPPSNLNQANNGSGWEIGAFVYGKSTGQPPDNGGNTTNTGGSYDLPPSNHKDGDSNEDGNVDGLDYVIWLNHYNIQVQDAYKSGDHNTDGVVDGLDYVIWLNNYGL